MSLDDFRKRVEELAVKRTGEPIYNATTDHAAVIAEAMFAHAKDHVHVLTGRFNPLVYGTEPAIAKARALLDERSGTLQILVEHDDLLEENPFFNAFVPHKNLVVKKVPVEVAKRYPYHFLVMDGDCYRFEGDKNQHAAVAAFGDKKGAENMERIFGILWNLAEPAKLPTGQVARV